MKKNYLFIKSAVAFLMMLVFTTGIFAQTPQFYNYATGANANSFPLGIAAGKMVQWLVGPGEFNTPTPATSGNITAFYCRIATGYPLNGTFNTFALCFLQTTATSLTSGQFFPGTYDTVYKRTSVTLTAAADTWLKITLDHPFAYDPTKSLIIQMEQCNATTSGYPLAHTNLSSNRRVWSVGGCPFTPYASVGVNVLNCGVDVGPAGNPNTPDYLYYKFENNPSATTIMNCAVPGVGTSTAPLTSLTLTDGGQFDTCATGTGLTSAGITTGYNWNMGAGSWTISMWLTIPTSSSGSAYYLFGDAGSGTFRCFHNGVALPDNLVLRGTGITDVTVTGIGPSPCVVTFVYDSAATTLKAYKNGVQSNTSTQTLNMTTGTGFKVGGYSTSPSYIGKLDEFRLYHRALTPTEVGVIWNENTPGCGATVGSTNQNTNVPTKYVLEQNYPNPFNPTTNINFSLPKAGDVKLVIFDALGREVITLVNEYMPVGHFTAKFNASSLSSGVYFYTITSGDFKDTKKMMLIK
jgi:hypothetical protein